MTSQYKIMILMFLFGLLAAFTFNPHFSLIRHEELILGLGDVQYDLANRVCKELHPSFRATFREGICEGCIMPFQEILFSIPILFFK